MGNDVPTPTSIDRRKGSEESVGCDAGGGFAACALEPSARTVRDEPTSIPATIQAATFDRLIARSFPPRRSENTLFDARAIRPFAKVSLTEQPLRSRRRTTPLLRPAGPRRRAPKELVRASPCNRSRTIGPTRPSHPWRYNRSRPRTQGSRCSRGRRSRPAPRGHTPIEDIAPQQPLRPSRHPLHLSRSLRWVLHHPTRPRRSRWIRRCPSLRHPLQPIVTLTSTVPRRGAPSTRRPCGARPRKGGPAAHAVEVQPPPPRFSRLEFPIRSRKILAK